MKSCRFQTILIFAVTLLLGTLTQAQAASIIGSKHDLSWVTRQSGDHGLGGLIDYGEVCIYCHTPHGANNQNGPLWNKNFSSNAASYTVYSSATLDAGPAAPPGSVSLLCLNCHDGATGVSSVRNAPANGWIDINPTIPRGLMKSGFSWGLCGTCHDGEGNYGHNGSGTYLGTDLSNDHPIGIGFPDPGKDKDFNLPGSLINGWTDVPLFNGKIECSTCHDVHDPQNVPFLNISNTKSALCSRCHKK